MVRRAWMRENYTTRLLSPSKCNRNVPNRKQFGVQSLEISLETVLFHRILRIWTGTSVVGWQLIDINVLLQFWFPRTSWTKNCDLVGRSGINPTLDNFPGRRKECGSIDDKHLVHGFGEAQGINSRLFFDDGHGSRIQLCHSQLSHIQNGNGLESGKFWIGGLVLSQSCCKIMNLHIPMVLDNVGNGSDALDGRNVEDTRLGKEDRDSILCDTTVNLRILGLINVGSAAQGWYRIGVISSRLGFGLAFGGLVDHLDDIRKDKLSGS